MGQYRAWRVEIRLFSINIRRLAMRFRAKVIVAALVMIPAVLTQTPASASWCAEYSGLRGTESCGFSSFEQCQASVSCIGGLCRPSQYNHPGYSSAERTKTRRYEFVSQRPIYRPRSGGCLRIFAFQPRL